MPDSEFSDGEKLLCVLLKINSVSVAGKEVFSSLLKTDISSAT